MKIRLKVPWADFLPGSIVSVSEERGQILISEKIGILAGKIDKPPGKIDKPKPTVQKRAKK